MAQNYESGQHAPVALATFVLRLPMSNFDLDAYFATVQELARGFLDALATVKTVALHQYLEEQMRDDSSFARSATRARVQFLTDADREKLRPRLKFFGYLPNLDEDTRLAWWALCNDVSAAAQRLSWQQQCERYHQRQALFVAEPTLFNEIRKRDGEPDLELIDEHSIIASGYGIYRVGSGYAKLVEALPSHLVDWARVQFVDSPRFIRLDPHRHHQTKPPVLIKRAAIVPADPTWLQNLSLNGRDYSEYRLLKDDPRDMVQYAFGVRRLEASASRKKPGYLSMMLEELPRPDDESGVMVGLCMHLDSLASSGTPVETATLEHLDLAINCYEGGKRDAREQKTMEHGVSEKASYRIHLYRIENIPFVALFDFASMFFRSRRLVEEWISDFRAREDMARNP